MTGTSKFTFSAAAEEFLSTCGTSKYLEVVDALAEIILNPKPDGVVKFQLRTFPYPKKDVIEFVKGDWYISYGMTGDGNVRIYSISPRIYLN